MQTKQILINEKLQLKNGPGFLANTNYLPLASTVFHFHVR